MADRKVSETLSKDSEQFLEDAHEHRRRTSRDVRHQSKAQLHRLAGDEDAIEDADLLLPQAAHDIGRKSSPRPRSAPKPGRRGGFKVWKTSFWKRRRAMWAEQNARSRRLADLD